MNFKTNLVALSILAVSGCATTEQFKIEKSVLSKESNVKEQGLERNLNTDEVGKHSARKMSSVNAAGVTPPNSVKDKMPKFDNKKVSIAANNLRVSDFIHLVFSEQLGLDYALSNKVRKSQASVALNITKPISKSKLYNNAKNVLSQSNIVFKEKSGIYFFELVNPKNKEGFNLGVGREVGSVPDVGGQILHVAPLYFADWRSMNRIANRLTNAKVDYLPERNAILITGVKQEIKQVLKIVNAFDRPSAKGRHIGMIDFVYLTPDEFREQIEEVLAIEGIKLVENTNEGVVAITPMKRMRSVLVHSASPSVFDRVMYWAKRLDVPSSSDGRRYYTYFPKNVSAVDMGKSLSQLFRLSDQAKPTATAQGNSSSSQGSSSGASATGASMQDLAMSVDEIQNALVFYATPSKYHEALELIERLDVMPGQVLIEAAIVEVTLDNSFKSGIDWTFQDGFPAQAKKQTLNIGSGLSYLIQGVDFNMTMSFLETNSRVKIVSRPRVLVRDGRSATMNVGTEIPVITQSVNDLDNTDQVLQTVQYRSTGVTLNVTPTINARGVVSMTLSQTVSAVGSDKIEGINSPTILNRSFNTELLALDGKTIILGGLISENTSNAGSGIPVLSDLPILGKLFGSDNKEDSRVELVVMITPKIIASEQGINEAIDAITSEYENFLFEL